MPQKVHHSQPVSHQEKKTVSSTPKKKFLLKEEEKTPLSPSPLMAFQTMLLDTPTALIQESGSTPIDEIFFSLCEKVSYLKNEGIEETTITLSQEMGEITLQKFDTAPMQFTLTFSLTEQATQQIAAHIPALQKRLSEQFDTIEFSMHSQVYRTRKEEKKYTVHKKQPL